MEKAKGIFKVKEKRQRQYLNPPHSTFKPEEHDSFDRNLWIYLGCFRSVDIFKKPRVG